ncbi:unnamed protein product, partial [Gongylonema pulchrum]|uniref:Protein kinase domain-containing protein n=1 Tax=Gongylonema pulchrum TaxID=637853 RepID=A0A183D7J2_9BILA
MDILVKLADFGLAIKISESRNSSHVCGTPNYISPQVLARKGHSKESEAWSIGCTLYCMLIGKPPFETDSQESTYLKIASCDYSFPRNLRISVDAEDLISKLLQLDPVLRMKIGEVKYHAYMLNSGKLRMSESYLSAVRRPLRMSEKQNKGQ